MKLEKTNEHIPNWYREMEAEKKQFQILEKEMEDTECFERELAEERSKEQKPEPLTLQDEPVKKPVGKKEKQNSQATVYKVEDLFQKNADGGGS